MSNFNDLFTGLKMLQDGVQQFNIQRSVNSAAEQFNQATEALQNEQLSQQEFRQKQKQLANNLALQLSGLGASGTQIESAFGAIKPQTFGSAEQLAIEAEVSDDPQLKEVSKTLALDRLQKKTDERKIDLNAQLALLKQQHQNNLALQTLKNNKDAEKNGLAPVFGLEQIKGTQLSAKNIQEASKVKAAYTSIYPKLKEFQELFKEVGTEYGGDKASRMEQLAEEILVQYNSNVAELGALAGPDLSILRNIISSATSIGANIKGALSFGYSNKSIQAKIDGLMKDTSNHYKSVLEANNFKIPERTWKNKKGFNTEQTPANETKYSNTIQMYNNNPQNNILNRQPSSNEGSPLSSSQRAGSARVINNLELEAARKTLPKLKNQLKRINDTWEIIKNKPGNKSGIIRQRENLLSEISELENKLK